jgi:hypothetical protein
MKKLKTFFVQFLAHPYIRFMVGYGRFRFLTAFRGVRILASEHSLDDTVSYNMTAFKNVITDFYMVRMEKLIYALLAVEKVNRESSVLVIGPRTESDLLRLKGLGIRNLVGLDLISYSPWIKLGDMHQIPFEQSQFDAVVIGWTISYSVNPKRAATEIVRVLKNGGLVAIGVEHVPPSSSRASDLNQSWPSDLDPADAQHRRPGTNSSNDLLKLFEGHVDKIYFNSDAPLAHLHPGEIQAITGLMGSLVMLVFEVRK